MRRNTRPPRHTLRPLLLACSLALGSLSMTASAQDVAVAPANANNTLLSVSAQAEASRAPDIATLSTGVVTQAADANGAMRANAEQMARLMTAIKAAGIAERDVQTSGINLSPQYRYAENQPPVITGYQASNSVNLKVRDIGRLGQVLDALVASGANQINGPTFEIDDADGVQDEARAAALKKAQARAEMYATSLGLRVLRLVSVSESGSGFQPPRPMMMMRAVAQDSAASPVSPGETTLTANLDVVFELGR
ncbi:SIMPL domain-containing protein [Luteimonas sp. BDR2-5]|uniref:SIMPL domain-containing protein n=1 Tax=Proluteimonas luteida TaxID=2878685 RepID=UPI001E3A4DBB|nr:SIMPL domain-containing protein [Luteimonas sp. BDR2-5]MCD9028096.1 SIMPL domain-containing protein [Luteimonas sp. BDR2-5]